MALTTEDLNQIKIIVESSESRLKKEILVSLDRMEGRIVTSINLLQRDSFSRLDDHDARIRRLEAAAQR